ncbi:hypothetical protein TNCV_2373291 [Trichonephila clavipes]|nr:hypothetical protein TNCV_4670261 [Trichonephila clavipes]GFX40545.1 hypothetical protein TNCV_2373291 [Trichonephila clavipes]
MKLRMMNKDMAERENSWECDKIFVQRTLKREKQILSNFLTEVYISLDEIENLMMDEPICQTTSNRMKREYLIRNLNRERKNILSLLTGIQWSIDHLENCLGESGIITPEIVILNER